MAYFRCIVPVLLTFVIAAVESQYFDVSAYKAVCGVGCFGECRNISTKTTPDCQKACVLSDLNISQFRKEKLPVIFKSKKSSFWCTEYNCLERNCTRDFNSTTKQSSVSIIGEISVVETACLIFLRWNLSNPKITNWKSPANRYFLWSETTNGSWTSIALNSSENPQFSLPKSSTEIGQIFRFLAISAAGTVSLSPSWIINAGTLNATQLTPIEDIQLVNLSSSGSRVNGLVIWKLPHGVNEMDVNSYRVSHSTTHCHIGSTPVVTLIPGHPAANISNMRFDCSYQFNVTYTTTCAAIGPEVSFPVKIDSDQFSKKNASLSENRSLSDSENRVKPPQQVKIVSVGVSWNESAGICAKVIWESPTDLGSANMLVGYEIFWAPVGRPVDAASWFVQFSGNESSEFIFGNGTEWMLCGLMEDAEYGVKVAIIGDVFYNVSNLLQYIPAQPFSTNVRGRGDDRKFTRTRILILSILVPISLTLLLSATILGCFWYKRRQLPYGFEKLQFLPARPLILRYKICEMKPSGKQPGNPTGKSKRKAPTPSNFDRWELPRSRIILGETLGKGAFGEVFKGVIKGSILISTGSNSIKHAEKYSDFTVAVKLLPMQDRAGQTEKEAFLREIEMMKEIGFHRNLVSLVGCCLNSQSMCLVEEFCPLGDLRKYLTDKRLGAAPTAENAEYFAESVTTEFRHVPVTLRTLLSYARQIAVGMEYLHRKGYLHRDLAARNILVVDETFVKIGDFGLSRQINTENIYVMKSPGRLPVKWMAIEAISDLVFTPASDVWAYGVVLFEIVTLGGTPYPNITNPDLPALLRSGHRMECPDSCPLELYSLMLRCWDSNWKERPSCGELVCQTESLLEKSAGSDEYLRLDYAKDYYTAIPGEEQTLESVLK